MTEKSIRFNFDYSTQSTVLRSTKYTYVGDTPGDTLTISFDTKRHDNFVVPSEEFIAKGMVNVPSLGIYYKYVGENNGLKYAVYDYKIQELNFKNEYLPIPLYFTVVIKGNMVARVIPSSYAPINKTPVNNGKQVQTQRPINNAKQSKAINTQMNDFNYNNAVGSSWDALDTRINKAINKVITERADEEDMKDVTITERYKIWVRSQIRKFVNGTTGITDDYLEALSYELLVDPELYDRADLAQKYLSEAHEKYKANNIQVGGKAVKKKVPKSKQTPWKVTAKTHKCKDGVTRKVYTDGKGAHAVKCKAGDRFVYRKV